MFNHFKMHLSTLSNQKILVACNDWGMGHLMRSIPIINQLLKQENEIVFVGTDFQLKVLKEYISSIETILQQGYPFSFKGDGKWSLEMLRNTRNLLQGIKADKKFVSKIITEKKITLIISDHRYGFRHQTIPSIFITHQVTLPLKGIQQVANQWHAKQLKKFTSIWVLDTDKHQFAGKLSTTKIALPIQYIGIQSRFSHREHETQNYILAVISGPEPYAEQLFNEIIQLAHHTDDKIICICQKKYHFTDLPNSLEIVNNASWLTMDELFYNCKSIISRSGYTTIMDNVILQKPIRYIPTPGQLEQAYLFQLHNN